MVRLLKTPGRWDVPIPCNAQEFTQASSPYITTKVRNDVRGVDSGDHPKPAFLFHRLDVRCPNQPAIRESRIRQGKDMAKYNINGAARMDMRVHEVRSDQTFVILTDIPESTLRRLWHQKLED